MHLNYYEAEWLTKLKLREAMKLTRRGIKGTRWEHKTASKRVEPMPMAPALCKSGSPC